MALVSQAVEVPGCVSCWRDSEGVGRRPGSSVKVSCSSIPSLAPRTQTKSFPRCPRDGADVSKSCPLDGVGVASGGGVRVCQLLARLLRRRSSAGELRQSFMQQPPGSRSRVRCDSVDAGCHSLCRSSPVHSSTGCRRLS
jgi:hypothetical protein